MVPPTQGSLPVEDFADIHLGEELRLHRADERAGGARRMLTFEAAGPVASETVHDSATCRCERCSAYPSLN